MGTEAPSLLDLCIRTAIDNVRYLGDVGETETEFLALILPHCNVDQLKHIENCSEGRDLSPVTDRLWKRFYEKEFGTRSMEEAVEKMKRKKVSFAWKRLYEVKLRAVEEAENEAVDKMSLLYKKEDARRQSKQIKVCTKVPPGNKRSFFGGSGSGSNASHLKSNLMKKTKIEFLNSPEVKNLAAMKKNGLQKNRISPTLKPSSTSNFSRLEKRF